MTPETIIGRIARHYGLSASELTSRSRVRHIAYARQVAAWGLRTALPKLSLATIGELLGNLDHTTVIYSVRQIADAVAADAALAAELYGLIGQAPPRPTRRADDAIWRDVRYVRTA